MDFDATLLEASSLNGVGNVRRHGYRARARLRAAQL
jgi:hypothetical protein